MFLRQCVLRGGLPFSVELPNYNQSVIDAMNEAKSISRDSNTPSYTNMTDLKAALEDDD